MVQPWMAWPCFGVHNVANRFSALVSGDDIRVGAEFKKKVSKNFKEKITAMKNKEELLEQEIKEKNEMISALQLRVDTIDLELNQSREDCESFKHKNEDYMESKHTFDH